MTVEVMTGVEPVYPALQAGALPLGHTTRCAHGRDRTCSLWCRRPALCPLSYAREVEGGALVLLSGQGSNLDLTVPKAAVLPVTPPEIRAQRTCSGSSPAERRCIFFPSP